MIRGATVALLIASSCTLVSAQNLRGIAFGVGVTYAPAPGGGIQAIRSTDGAVLWTSTRARWPLAYAGDKLAALGPVSNGNSSTIEFLDATTGRSLAGLGPIQFESWASVRCDYRKSSESDFRIWTQWINDNNALFLWRAERWSPIDVRHLSRPQTRQYASGRIEVQFSNNSVRSSKGPIREGPPTHRPDESLPLLRNQKLIDSVPVNADDVVALVRTGSDVNLLYFASRVLRWSRVVATNRK